MDTFPETELSSILDKTQYDCNLLSAETMTWSKQNKYYAHFALWKISTRQHGTENSMRGIFNFQCLPVLDFERVHVSMLTHKCKLGACYMPTNTQTRLPSVEEL